MSTTTNYANTLALMTASELRAEHVRQNNLYVQASRGGVRALHRNRRDMVEREVARRNSKWLEEN